MNPPDHYLVVGTGSIAKRHIRNLKSLFPGSRIVSVSASGRSFSVNETGADMVSKDLIEASKIPCRFAVVASPAPSHLSQAAILLSAGIPTLVEKPLTDSVQRLESEGDYLINYEGKIDVAYNLRFLSSAQKMREYLDHTIIGRLHTVIVDVGQYLPDWRPGVDYRQTVSARSDLGGGAILELSHDLDYLLWLFGPFQNVICSASTSGSLDIDVEDKVNSIILNDEGLSVLVNMDFLQRKPCRFCKVIGETGTLIWNILENSICLERPGERPSILSSDPGYDRNHMYIEELRHFDLVVKGKTQPAVGLRQAKQTIRLAEALKVSAQTNQYVTVKVIDQ